VDPNVDVERSKLLEQRSVEIAHRTSNERHRADVAVRILDDQPIIDEVEIDREHVIAIGHR
jgi:hypothetical protein